MDGHSAVTAPAWVVLKFGGTSVSTRARWDQIGARIAERRAEGKRVLVVVSALSGVTNALTAIADCPDSEARGLQAAGLRERHLKFAAELDLDGPAVLNDLLDRLDALAIDSRAAAEESLRLTWQAELLGMGELLSSRLGSAYLTPAGQTLHW